MYPTLPQLDLYGPVHRGLRYALSSLLTRMGAADLTDACRQILDDDGVLFMCASHLEHEERHIHPALEARVPGVVAALEREHREHQQAIDGLGAFVAELVSAPLGQRPAMARELYLRFALFVAESFVHMNHEERTIQALLDEHFSVDELSALHASLMSKIGPDELLVFTRVMVPANQREVRIAMLTGAREAMTPDAFAALVRSFRTTLDADDWNDLTRRLDVAA